MHGPVPDKHHEPIDRICPMLNRECIRETCVGFRNPGEPYRPRCDVLSIMLPKGDEPKSPIPLSDSC